MILVLFGAIAGMPIAARGADAEVTIKNTAFNPQGVTIDIGDKVVWKDDEGGHDITFDDGTFQQPPGCSAALGLGCTQKGDRIERHFEKAGAFKYHCSRHGTGMSGLVNVQGSAAVTTTTAAPTTTEPPTTVTTAATTTTTRKLATSSTQASTTTTTAPAESATTLTPNEAPAFDPGDGGDGDGESGASTPASGDGGGGGGSGTVALIVGVLLAVAGGGGVLLWRLRPRPAQP